MIWKVGFDRGATFSTFGIVRNMHDMNLEHVPFTKHISCTIHKLIETASLLPTK